MFYVCTKAQNDTLVRSLEPISMRRMDYFGEMHNCLNLLYLILAEVEQQYLR
jgi:hypothetical protein